MIVYLSDWEKWANNNKNQVFNYSVRLLSESWWAYLWLGCEVADIETDFELLSMNVSYFFIILSHFRLLRTSFTGFSTTLYSCELLRTWFWVSFEKANLFWIILSPFKQLRTFANIIFGHFQQERTSSPWFWTNFDNCELLRTCLFRQLSFFEQQRA